MSENNSPQQSPSEGSLVDEVDEPLESETLEDEEEIETATIEEEGEIQKSPSPKESKIEDIKSAGKASTGRSNIGSLDHLSRLSTPHRRRYRDPYNENAFQVKSSALTGRVPESTSRLATPKTYPEYPENRPMQIPSSWLNSDYLREYQPSKRIQRMATPRQIPQSYRKPRRLSELGLPPTSALYYEATERLKQLAIPQTREDNYIDPVRDDAFHVKKSALKSLGSPNMDRLAAPKEVCEAPEKKKKKIPAEWTEGDYLKTYQPSERIQAMAKPHNRLDRYLNPRKLSDLGRPPRQALTYEATERMKVLAEPHSTTYMNPVRDDAFTVKKAALNSSGSPNMERLAKPKGEHTPPEKKPSKRLRKRTEGNNLEEYQPTERLLQLAEPQTRLTQYLPPTKLSDISRPSPAALNYSATSHTKWLAEPLTHYSYREPIHENAFKVKRSALTSSGSPNMDRLAAPKEICEPPEKKPKKIPAEWMESDYLKTYQPSPRIQAMAKPNSIFDFYLSPRKLSDVSRPPAAALNYNATERTKQLATPQSHDKNYVDPVRDDAFHVKKSALASNGSPNMDRLAAPKEVCEAPEKKSKKMPAEWTEGDYLKTYQPSERIQAMAKPTERQDQYLAPRKLSDVSRPSRRALTYEATERMQSLAQPHNHAETYVSPVWKDAFTVKKAALTSSGSPNMDRLAMPKIVQELPENKPKNIPPEWLACHYLEEYQPSKRIQEMAKPHNRLDNYLPPRKLTDISRPPVAALTFNATERLEWLALPHTHSNYRSPVRENAFKVKKSALASCCPRNLDRLAVPKEICEAPEKKPKKIPAEWADADYLKTYQPSERIQSMAKPQDRHTNYLAPRKLSDISRPPLGALNYQATDRIQELALPLTRSSTYIDPVNKSSFSVSKRALQYNATPRIEQLAIPKPDYPEPHEVHGKGDVY